MTSRTTHPPVMPVNARAAHLNRPARMADGMEERNQTATNDLSARAVAEDSLGIKREKQVEMCT